jgi:hypothetical protein
MFVRYFVCSCVYLASLFGVILFCGLDLCFDP